MKNKIKLFFIILLLLIILSSNNTVKAEVIDNATVLTEEEIEILNKKISEKEVEAKMNIIIHTYESSYKNTDYTYDELEYFIEQYEKEWYNKEKNNLKYKKTAFFFIDMNSRTIFIDAEGTKYRCNDNSDMSYYTIDYLRTEKYFESFNYFIDNIDSEITSYKVKTWIIKIIIGIVSGTAVSLYLVLTVGSKKTATFRNYIDRDFRTLKGSDRLIDVSETKTKINTDNNDGNSRIGIRGGHGHF